MIRFFPLACLLAAAVACAEPPLAFPADTPLDVLALNGEGRPGRWTIAPSDPRFATMHDWLAHHAQGWSAQPATPPDRGIVVSAGSLRVQFSGSSAYACRDAAPCVHRAVDPADYRFLIGR